MLDREGNQEFLDDFLAFQRLVSHHGMINSLAQTLLKIASPGVPDTYQGTELWDFSLVDPDNRRPVDYDRRSSMLKDLISRRGDPGQLVRELVAAPRDGLIKLYIHWKALAARRQNPGLFSSGEYRPLRGRGKHESSLFAFLRVEGSREAIVAVPRLTTRLGSIDRFPTGVNTWADTELELAGLAEGTVFRNVFTGARHTIETGKEGSRIMAGDLFADFPIALLLEESAWRNNRRVRSASRVLSLLPSFPSNDGVDIVILGLERSHLGPLQGEPWTAGRQVPRRSGP